MANRRRDPLLQLLRARVVPDHHTRRLGGTNLCLTIGVRRNLRDGVAGRTPDDAVRRQQLRGLTFAFTQQAEQQMLRSDHLMMELLRFFRRRAKDASACRAERELLQRRLRVMALQRMLDFLQHQLRVSLECAQQRHGGSIGVAEQAVEKMFGADEVVLPTFRLTKRPLHRAERRQ